MSTLRIRGGASVDGTVVLPGDKAISHRGLLLGAAAHGTTTLRGLATGQDVASTRSCLEDYGVRIEGRNGVVVLDGRGVGAWREPTGPLDCGNSATTMRVLSGLAARCAFRTVLDGDTSLRRRPMDRVVTPLRALGADVRARSGRPPLQVRGGALRGADILLPVASGQVKSCVLLAGLGAEGRTAVTEPAPSRDDTERMLTALGADVSSTRQGDGSVRVEVAPRELPSFEIDIPGDLSSATFVVAAALLAGRVRIEDASLNDSRAGFLHAVARMGARVSWDIEDTRVGEPAGTIHAERSRLQGIGLEAPVIPSLLDELPVLAVLATQARGPTTVRGARELRVKESDRIAALADVLGRLGARFTVLDDGFVVEGPVQLCGATVDSWGDHRIAIAAAIAAIAADGETRVTGWEASEVSWPGFERVLRDLGVHCEVE